MFSSAMNANSINITFLDFTQERTTSGFRTCYKIKFWKS